MCICGIELSFWNWTHLFLKVKKMCQNKILKEIKNLKNWAPTYTFKEPTNIVNLACILTKDYNISGTIGLTRYITFWWVKPFSHSFFLYWEEAFGRNMVESTLYHECDYIPNCCIQKFPLLKSFWYKNSTKINQGKWWWYNKVNSNSCRTRQVFAGGWTKASQTCLPCQ